MNILRPFIDRGFWVRDGVELAYEHAASNVIHLNTAHARAHALANAAQGAAALENDRAEGKRLWDAYLAAIRKSVDAQGVVTEAHNAWMEYQGRGSRG
jgi:hypothetical protein